MNAGEVVRREQGKWQACRAGNDATDQLAKKQLLQHFSLSSELPVISLSVKNAEVALAGCP
jgi:hypothetical protein